MYITVLDFNDGKVYQYEAEPEAFEDYETWLDEKGHNVSNVQWMLHEDNEIITS